jgi:hypothetical protein
VQAGLVQPPVDTGLDLHVPGRPGVLQVHDHLVDRAEGQRPRYLALRRQLGRHVLRHTAPPPPRTRSRADSTGARLRRADDVISRVDREASEWARSALHLRDTSAGGGRCWGSTASPPTRAVCVGRKGDRNWLYSGMATAGDAAARTALRRTLAAAQRDDVTIFRPGDPWSVDSVAAPVRDSQGRVVGALSIVVPDGTLNPQLLTTAVRTTARSIGRASDRTMSRLVR